MSGRDRRPGVSQGGGGRRVQHGGVVVGEHRETIVGRKGLAGTRQQRDNAPVMTVKAGTGGEVCIVTPVLLMSAISDADCGSRSRVGNPGTLAVEGDDVVVKHIVNFNLLVEVPSHQLEKNVVGIQTRGTEFVMEI